MSFDRKFMATINCPVCNFAIDDSEKFCPRCKNPIRTADSEKRPKRSLIWGYEYKSSAKILGWPLLHIAIGRDEDTGRLLVARGIIAIGQFGIGLITIAQFGIGVLFGLGQFVGGIFAIGQFALGLSFGLGQFATGMTAIGQFALGRYVLAQIGFGEHVWSTKIRDPEAVEYFSNLWNQISGLIDW